MPSHEHDQQPDAGGPLEHEGLVRQWLASAADGDEDAWREIVGAYAKRVYGLLRSRGCDQGRAEEITQSVFVTVARVVGQGQYSEQGRFDAWLFRVAMNRLRDDARARKRRQTHELGDAAEAMPAASEPAAAPAEDFGSLRAALGGLSAADREVIELRHRADMSFNQIAELLGQPLGTVLARHHRALRKLRGVLEGAKQSTA
ncbi:MAG: sigma-70 family RNA polymerase sigma factor [Phycisphaerales bacterium]